MSMGELGGGGRRIYGVVIGVVTDNKHPEGEYRVKVKFPWIRSTDAGDQEDFISSWARITTPMAGLGRGVWLLPEVDDEVLVMFEHGDVRRPFVVGSLWNGKDVPPVGDKAPANTTDPLGVDLALGDVCKDNKEHDGKNPNRFIHTRSGHSLIFDDGAEDADGKVVIKTKAGHTIVLNDKGGNESIAIYGGKGEEYLYLDEANKKIILETKNGDIDILCKNGKLNIEAKEIVSKASTTASHEATDKMTHKSKEVVVKGDSKIDMDGGKIELN